MGSLTLMQALVSETTARADVLQRALHGMSILGLGLMEGHEAVIAKVNRTLAEAVVTAAKTK